MKQRFAAPLALLAIISFGATAIAAVYDWPVARVLLTATFGETRSDHFHNVIDLGGDGQRVTPIAPGEVVYYFDEGEHPLYRSHGNGNIVIVQHANAERSYYYHMRDASVATANAGAGGKGQVAKDDIIGLSGNTGRSMGAHLHLSISDREGYINPLSVLPRYPDRVSPEVASVLFDVEGRIITVPDRYRVSGIYTFSLLARVWDSQEDIRNVNTLAPYRLTFALDDKVLKIITFDRLTEKDGRITLMDGSGFNDTWSSDGYLIGGEYRGLTGQHTISVLAEDFAGNQALRTVNVYFR